MQIKYKIILSVGLLCGVVLSMNFVLAERKEDTKSVSPLPIKTPENRIKSFLAKEGPDAICAIVIMPKSYQAAFERFSRGRIAKSVKILPARFEWSQGKMVFMPEKDILKDDNPLTRQGKFTSSATKTAYVEFQAQEDKMFQRVALLYLLAGVAGAKKPLLK